MDFHSPQSQQHQNSHQISHQNSHQISQSEKLITDPIELGKQRAAYCAIDENVHDGMLVGLGSGSTIVYAVQRLSQRLHELPRVRFFPTSFQTRLLCQDMHLSLGDLNDTPLLDVAIDGADETDSELNAIKGGGACHLQEKLVASNARKFIIIADSRKDSEKLGQKWTQGVPIEVVPQAYGAVQEQVSALGGKSTLRMAVKKAGPLITDNGNFVLDVVFGEIPVDKVAQLNQQILAIAGVIESGLFVNMASKAYFGQPDGSVVIKKNDRASSLGAIYEHYIAQRVQNIGTHT